MSDYDIFELETVSLQSGLTLRQAQLAYKTYGQLNAARDNVIVMPTFYGAQHAENEALMAAWPALDPKKYFLIVPTMSGNGLSSSRSTTASLGADATVAERWYHTPPIRGLRAFSRVYMGWAFSQDFFRDQEYRKMGFASLEDSIRFLEGYFRRRDANDLLAMLWTWQHADMSANERYKGDVAAALGAIKARAIVMPGATDL